MNFHSMTTRLAMITACSVLAPAVAEVDLGNKQNFDRAINTTLRLEHSWHTTLQINPTPQRSIRIDIPIENTTLYVRT